MHTGPETVSLPGRFPPALLLNLASLGLLVWGVWSSGHLGSGGTHVLELTTLVLATVGWIVELLLRDRPHERAGLVAVALMVVSGGILTAFVPLGVTYVGVGGLLAGVRLEIQLAALVSIVGPIATAVAVGADRPRPVGAIFYSLAAALAGMVMGHGRRLLAVRTQHAALLAVANDKADLERQRAELLSEKNRLAREIHDVLAHTLSALAVRVEALSAATEAAAPEGAGAGTGLPPSFVEDVEEIRRLVRGGLDEAREAVQALREDARPLAEQLERLCANRGASLLVEGEARRLSPEVTATLRRIAQEALTNALKHAPGSPVSVRLSYEPTGVALEVENPVPAHRNGSRPDRDSSEPELADSGGGYGLEGMRERVLLIGGRVEAGSVEDRWRVLAEVPA